MEVFETRLSGLSHALRRLLVPVVRDDLRIVAVWLFEAVARFEIAAKSSCLSECSIRSAWNRVKFTRLSAVV